MKECSNPCLIWRRSSACADNTCVEVADGGNWVYLRDSKEIGGAVLRFTRSEWSAFQAGMRLGDFDFD
jgi:Domain of unknown function (DUF397)